MTNDSTSQNLTNSTSLPEQLHPHSTPVAKQRSSAVTSRSTKDSNGGKHRSFSMSQLSRRKRRKQASREDAQSESLSQASRGSERRRPYSMLLAHPFRFELVAIVCENFCFIVKLFNNVLNISNFHLHVVSMYPLTWMFSLT